MLGRAAFLTTMISLATAAFGVVAALAWNAFITELVKSLLPDQSGIVGLFVYAVVITVIAVLVIIWLGNLAARYAEKSAI